jgi:tRNA(His) guanylyltransferase
MNKLDELGDRMKIYEGIECNRRFMALLPVCVRIDGKGFHQFTKGLDVPFDENLTLLMQIVTEALVKETNAVIGHTQSDEISLIYYSNSVKSQILFDRKIFKIVSVLASLTTATFNRYLPELIPQKAHRVALFDCRAWSVPTLVEAANTILWREFDATKNSISMAARSCYSHKQLQGKNGKDMQELLLKKDINWNDYPASFKRGTYYQRRKIVRKYTIDEIEKLPPQHNARKNPDMETVRTEVRKLDMPPFSKVLNRVGVIFGEEVPVTDTKDLV